MHRKCAFSRRPACAAPAFAKPRSKRASPRVRTSSAATRARPIPGPFSLGTGKTAFPLRAIKRDMRLMLKARAAARIPLLIGSAGTAGGDAASRAVRRASSRKSRARRSSRFRLALIHAEQDKAYLKRRLREGRIKPLSPAPRFDAGTIDRSDAHRRHDGRGALACGARRTARDVILAGRSSDTAIFAGFPITHGLPRGHRVARGEDPRMRRGRRRRSQDARLHVRVRCGTTTSSSSRSDPALRCTPQSIASHSLYENGDPFRSWNARGTLDLTDADYEALERARGQGLAAAPSIPAERYTVKLEGAELAGYQSIVIGSVRDPTSFARSTTGPRACTNASHARVKMSSASDRSAERLYDSTSASTARTAPWARSSRSRKSARTSCASHRGHRADAGDRQLDRRHRRGTRRCTCRFRNGAASSPRSPAPTTRRTSIAAPVYRFNVNHVVEPDDPLRDVSHGVGRRR